MDPNNKPYISKEIKECTAQKKKVAFKSGDLVRMKNLHRDLKHRLGTARDETREKSESV